MDDRYKHDTVAVQDQKRSPITYETDLRTSVEERVLLTGIRFYSVLMTAYLSRNLRSQSLRMSRQT